MRKLIPLAAAAALTAAAPAPRVETALFAGGCFWSIQTDLGPVPGVLSSTVGYAGGHVARPSYEQVSTGQTGHREAILIRFDPSRISYARLLDRYYHTIDPTDGGGAFCDRGDEYRPAVFALTPDQARIAAAERAAVAAMPRFRGKTIAVEDRGPAPFYAAEAYHQDYHSKNPLAYATYRIGCGRDGRLRAVWGQSPADWR